MVARQIDFEDFLKIDLRVGTVISARPNRKARIPAFIMEIDFGDELGAKTTSAQITDNYDIASLPGRQVVAVVNFPGKRIAGVKSEVLVLGAVGDSGVVLLRPDRETPPGLKIA